VICKGLPVARQGSNLPEFRRHQLDFAAYIRNPELNPAPHGVEARRMQIYLRLFYNNIEGFVAHAFPVAKQVLGDAAWHELVRSFVHKHPSESPYFLEVSQEFLTFLGGMDRNRLPAYLLELCHYEWVELALAVSEEEIPEEGIDPHGDLLREAVVVSPLIWPLSYQFPVHQIGPDFQPAAPSAEPTQLIVYRRKDDRVRFLEVNALTLRLLEVLDGSVAGTVALTQIASELPALRSQVVHDRGLATMRRLLDAEIILGTRVSP
jgi:hypothetical protein